MTVPTEGVPTPAPEWLPVPEAADAAGIPVRSLYRWIEKKRVPTRQERGTTLVDVAAVRAYAARRATLKESGACAGNVGTNAGNGDGNGATDGGVSGTGRARGMEETRASGMPPSATRPAPAVNGNAGSAITDADLAAEVFTRFEEGDTPVDVVRELRLPPERVRALHREWTDLRALGGNGGPSLAERVAFLEDQLKGLVESVSGQMFGMDAMALDALDRVQALEQRVASMPLPSAMDFTCPGCRAHGLLSANASCGHCRTTFTFGPRR